MCDSLLLTLSGYFLPGGFCSEPVQQKYSEINGGDAFPGNGKLKFRSVLESAQWITSSSENFQSASLAPAHQNSQAG